MVYESDFYTTRRPYSSSRPYTSSYTVTPLRSLYYLYDPYVFRFYVRTIPHLPYVAHKRLVTIVRSAPVRIYHAGSYLPIKIRTRVRPSIIAAELNRIRYLYRPSYQSYVEKYLSSRDFIQNRFKVDDEDYNDDDEQNDRYAYKPLPETTPETIAILARDFDDEARAIRAKTDNLLRKIHVFVPRPVLSDYEELTSPERLRSDDYVRRIINAKNARKDIEDLPWYTTPQKRQIGAGHLACIKYAGGRPQSKRRSYYTVSDLVPGDVKTDVKLMSYYLKNRKAAEDACGKQYSKAPTSWRDRVPELYEDPSKARKLKAQEEEEELDDFELDD